MRYFACDRKREVTVVDLAKGEDSGDRTIVLSCLRRI